MKLDACVAIVTGGASGLGKAVVETLLERGAHVAIFDRADGAQVNTGDRRVLFHRVDITSEPQVAKGIAMAMARFGRIDVCVNCAGIFDVVPIVAPDGAPFPIDRFARIIDVNLTGSVLVLARAAAQMAKNALSDERQERGVIINTASIAAFDGGAGRAAYTASKGALTAMALSLARDLQDQAIRVNTIAPGTMETELFDTLRPEQVAAYRKQQIFPRRWGRPREFAALTCHLIENEYLNGETIRLDGAVRV